MMVVCFCGSSVAISGGFGCACMAVVIALMNGSMTWFCVVGILSVCWRCIRILETGLVRASDLLRREGFGSYLFDTSSKIDYHLILNESSLVSFRVTVV